ncbi:MULTISPECIES: D-2-hydroxyacid dehydrogenase family protein [unclassified Polynucleobacter]|uniref:D-2-hydroxyacid dehydrogenase family protein n=1 Tax=unclassified Polynucleobacter TaxID=2640945 RepID=UPI0008BC06CB|nr:MULTISPECIES: D-2-hydroxyacid dehydrogenase family protein [unclassified Polynucleobacter]OHC10525.1 MAG: hydroxyacid dehydrogenase [Polynucleobacter sp. GWA2_45_21]HBK44369.1 hydroxyacid dehydrogenase [Polynucleobacter sp.]
MANLPNVVILGDYERALRRFSNWDKVDRRCHITIHHEPLHGEALYEAIKDADVIVLVRDRTPFNEALIARLPKLKLFLFTGKRNGTLDAPALISRNIPVACTPGGPSKETTTELTWALILGASKHLVRQNNLLHSGGWRDELSVLPMLSGERLGIIGLGSIGSAVAKVGKAFGMELVTWSPNMTTERAAAQNAKSVSLEELLKTSKVVSLHLVAGPKTKGLIGAQELAMMRSDALLVNTSRSALINTQALQAALAAGRPGQAAIDVFEIEPLPIDDALRNIPNLLTTPHLGFVAEPVFATFSKGIVDTLESWLEHKPLLHPFEP